MTLAELRTAVRYLAKELQTDSGTLLESDNVLLDFFIDSATELVTLDLVELMPEVFLSYEDLDLTVAVNYTDPDAEFLQIWALQENTSDKSPRIIPYLDIPAEQRAQYVGQTGADPKWFYTAGNRIYWIPTPSESKTDYARLWYIGAEAADVATGGPTLIPRMGHKLIVFQALILICAMDGAETTRWEKLYGYFHTRLVSIYHNRIQQQPRFLRGATQAPEDLDPTIYDTSPFFE